MSNLSRIKDTGIVIKLGVNPYFVVEMKNKPAMVKAKENYKIRELEESYRKRAVYEVVTKLLNQLGITDKGSTDHHTELIQFISENETMFTCQEVLLAFKYYQQGEYKDDKGNTMIVYSKLDVATYCKVMLKYDEKQKAELDEYRRLRKLQLTPKKELTEAEKRERNIKAIYNDFEFFKENKEMPFGGAGSEETFNILFKEKIFNRSPEADRFYKRVLEEARAEIKKEKTADLSSNKITRSDYKNIINSIKNKNSKIVETRAKRISVLKYFTKLVNNDNHIKDFLK